MVNLLGYFIELGYVIELASPNLLCSFNELSFRFNVLFE
jgi:hypothetical protein